MSVHRDILYDCIVPNNVIIKGNYTLGQKRSTDIREQFDIFNINNKLTQYKINWREHIQRMDDNKLPQKKITNLKAE